MKYANKRIGIAALALFLLGATNAFAEEFLVGAELPLTGSLARIGGGINEGISVAVEVFNKTNGKHKIKIVTVDDESAPAKADQATSVGDLGAAKGLGRGGPPHAINRRLPKKRRHTLPGSTFHNGSEDPQLRRVEP